MNGTADEAISVFPNPTTNYLTIKNISEPVTIEIYNTYGQKVKQAVGKTVNVESLKPGMYIVRFSVDGNNNTFKIMKK
jgi:hypothetical protein